MQMNVNAPGAIVNSNLALGYVEGTSGRELEAAAAAKGWNVIAVFEDAGISGANGRDKRPGFDAMLKDAVRRKFHVLMAWSGHATG